MAASQQTPAVNKFYQPQQQIHYKTITIIGETWLRAQWLNQVDVSARPFLGNGINFKAQILIIRTTTILFDLIA
jgi:hypothetical protein